LDLLDPDTITVTEYHNVHPLQQFSRTQHKAGNGSSACVPRQQSSGIPCHQFLTSSPKTTPLNLPTTPRIPTTTATHYPAQRYMTSGRTVEETVLLALVV
jgi:hypothetical protein